jgi:hypothetical protein
MNFYFDTEFFENGKTIELISIGIVAEDGDEFYTEVEGVEITDTWLKENVEPYLIGSTMTHDKIGKAILDFITAKTFKPVFWAYYADYDWVAFCQLYGRMIDLPSIYPMFCMDLKQQLLSKSVENIPIENEQEHSALSDARWTKEVHEWLTSGKQ